MTEFDEIGRLTSNKKLIAYYMQDGQDSFYAIIESRHPIQAHWKRGHLSKHTFLALAPFIMRSNYQVYRNIGVWKDLESQKYIIELINIIKIHQILIT